MQTAIFLESLKDSSLQLLDFTNDLQQRYSREALETTDGPGRWNCLQVLEHLNSYYRYYFPIIEQRMASAGAQPLGEYNPGWLGAYLTRSMLPKNEAVGLKMKAFKDHSPARDMNAAAVLAEFSSHQRRLLDTLDRAAGVDMKAIRIPISIARWIKLPLGDLLSFLVAHNERHHFQMEKLLGLGHQPFALELHPSGGTRRVGSQA